MNVNAVLFADTGGKQTGQAAREPQEELKTA
jgi:hypothetical protein